MHVSDGGNQPEPIDPRQPASGPAGGDAPPCARQPEEIQEWLVNYLARILETPPAEIDVDASFDQFALDSVNAIGMTGDLETWLGVQIDPMVAYDYPTIRSLSQYLAELSAANKPT